MSDTPPSKGPVLAFDTSAAHCAAALLVDGRLHTQAEEMTRGQAEALMPMLETLLATHRLAYRDLSCIGVGVGPGNFTGIRISVSAARGLAMGLNIRAVGVSGFDALRHGTGAQMAAIPAPRDTAYVQIDDSPPQQMALNAVPSDAVWPGRPETLVGAIAAIAGREAVMAPKNAPRPSPLYVRRPDAAPAREPAPLILDDT